ncbi:conserved hypothetical protein, partial [Trichinella spiralis]|uniref:hypothetical protein n=1 Tax=Trichinella spiralis TaxID=6334 RepID=UPI0001EFD68F
MAIIYGDRRCVNTDRWLGTRIPTTDMILRKRPEKTIFLAAVTAVSFNDTSFQQILENRLPDQSNLQLTVAKENFQVRIKNSQSTEVYLPRRGQRSGSKNSRRWRSPSRTSSGSLTPLTLYVATARSKCTNTRATTVVPN